MLFENKLLTVNYPPTAKLMGWASCFTDPTKGNYPGLAIEAFKTLDLN